MSTVRKEHVIEQLEAAVRENNWHSVVILLHRHLGLSVNKSSELFETFKRDKNRGLALVDLHFLRP